MVEFFTSKFHLQYQLGLLERYHDDTGCPDRDKVDRPGNSTSRSLRPYSCYTRVVSKLPPQGGEASSGAVMGKASVLNKVYPIMIGEARGVAWQVGGGIHRFDSERALDQYSSTPLCWEHALHACTCAAPVAALCVRYDT